MGLSSAHSSPRPARVRSSWEQGASGERIVGAWLDQIPDIVVLRDRRTPGSRTTIDHLAVAPRGVFLVDAKLTGRPLPPREIRGLLRSDDAALPGERDHEKHIARLANQARALVRVLADAPVPVAPALCLVDAHGDATPRSFVRNGVWVGTPAALAELVTTPGFLDAEAIGTVAARLDTRLVGG